MIEEDATYFPFYKHNKENVKLVHLLLELSQVNKNQERDRWQYPVMSFCSLNTLQAV